MSDANAEPQDAAESLDGDKIADDEVFADDELTVIPPDRPMGIGTYGLTAAEDAIDEPVAERHDHEQPEVWEHADRLDGDAAQVGRLVEPDAGGAPDLEPDAVADAVGGLSDEMSAEEAAVHVTPAPPMGDGDGYVDDDTT
jgi:hypothetical protein